MKTEFVNYIESIGLTTTVTRQRIESIYDFFSEVCPDEIKDIFVSEYLNQDGTREYENLWFFSDQYLMEAKQFRNKDDFDLTPYKEHLTYWCIKKEDYDFKTTSATSKIFILFTIKHHMKAEIKATKENCNVLKDILLKYVKPNLK